MKKNSYLLSCLAIAVSSACHAEVLTYPDPLGSSQSDFGGTGLLQMGLVDQIQSWMVAPQPAGRA